LAQDATEQIDVEYEQLEPILNANNAVAEEDNLIHPEMQDLDDIENNVSYSHHVDVGDVREGFENADHVVEAEFEPEYINATPMEPHGSLAKWNPSKEKLEIWASTQSPHKVKGNLADILDLKASKIRVYKPEVGGGFGNKGSIYPHMIMSAFLSIETDRPVKFVLGRREQIKATSSCFKYHIGGKLGITDEGEITALSMDVLHDEGAYHSWGAALLSLGLSGPSTIPYKIDNIEMEGSVVYTNKVPAAPVRGTCLRQITFARERLLNKAANEAGIDQLEIRKKNVITEQECPYQVPDGTYVDSCGIERAIAEIEDEYHEMMAKADDVPNKGVGVGAMMEWSGCRHGPMDADFDSAVVRMEEDGTIRIQSSSADMGTATRTTLAQVCAEELGIDVDDISVIEGDTDSTPAGMGSWGSRTMAVTGTAVNQAAQEVRERLLAIAAHNLEATKEDLEISDGEIHISGAPERSISISEIANYAHYDKSKLPPEMSNGALIGKASFDTGDDSLVTPTEVPDENGRGNMSMTYSSGIHIGLTTVGPETGKVEIERYVIGDDVGKAVNPDIVKGQIQGAAIQGMSFALGENLVHDEDGKLVTDDFGTYPIRTSADVPPIEENLVEVPSLNTPGGWKGCGESGMVPTLATIGNSVSNAVGREFDSMPLTPDVVYDKISCDADK
jgi:carbon-monoxide dehydrogenase large subunit